MVTDQQFILN